MKEKKNDIKTRFSYDLTVVFRFLFVSFFSSFYMSGLLLLKEKS